MRLATVQQCRLIDEKSQREYGLPSDLLMESAGQAAAQSLIQNFSGELQRGWVVIVCGPGHNGGDGMVVARHLISNGFSKLAVIVTDTKENSSNLVRLQIERLQAQKTPILNWESDKDEARQKIKRAAVIVDALFGTGLSRPLEGKYKEIVTAINAVSAPKVSLDTPSGLDGDRGAVMGVAVKAQVTLTFGLAKPGFFVREGPAHVGSLKVLAIAFPKSLISKIANTHFLLSAKAARKILPRRSNLGNKSTHGRSMILAGSEGKWGAALLASQAAFRIGSGYVIVSSFEDAKPILKHLPEVMTASAGQFKVEKNFAYAVGPGLGTSRQTLDLIFHLLRENAEKVVLDADALTSFSAFAQDGRKLPPSWVLTPHSGELAKLMGVSSDEINRDPYKWALEAAERTGATVLLKGFHTVIAREGKCLVIPTGNSALAKAGTGDILTGLIVGLMAQGLESLKAAALASYVHGKMADDWVRSGQDKRSLIASDLLSLLPRTLNSLSRGLHP